MDAPGTGRTATAYATGRDRENAAPDAAEVWLRGNVRPVLAGGACVVVGLALVAAATAAAGAGPGVLWPLGGAAAAAALVTSALARAASGLRLGRRGDVLLVRLAPWRTSEVPLAVVECVFPGSQPLAGPVLRHATVVEAEADGGPRPTRRVGTLVIRFAERAAAWRERPTFAPWGTWHDGHVIIDGRWCEPLSADVARTVSGRLLEAKREAATGEPAP